MGWLGWTWDTIRTEDVNALLLALEGREELLQAIFGKGDKPQPGKRMTNDAFKAFAATHNRRYAQKSGGRGRTRGS